MFVVQMINLVNGDMMWCCIMHHAEKLFTLIRLLIFMRKYKVRTKKAGVRLDKIKIRNTAK